MEQISTGYESNALTRGAARLSARLRDGIKWWAEHQAWPAIDEIRIDDRAPADKAERATHLRF